MVKNAAGFGVVLTCLLGVASAAAQTIAPAAGTDPMSWINHYPSDTVLGQPGFFNIPAINKKLSDMLSKDDFNLVVNVYTVETPITMVDGYIIVSNCMPHDCGDEGDTIVYNPKTGDIVVGLIDNDAGPAGQYMNEKLYGTADYTQLPGDVFKLLF
jgi:hypothetical protein